MKKKKFKKSKKKKNLKISLSEITAINNKKKSKIGHKEKSSFLLRKVLNLIFISINFLLISNNPFPFPSRFLSSLPLKWKRQKNHLLFTKNSLFKEIQSLKKKKEILPFVGSYARLDIPLALEKCKVGKKVLIEL